MRFFTHGQQRLPCSRNRISVFSRAGDAPLISNVDASSLYEMRTKAGDTVNAGPAMKRHADDSAAADPRRRSFHSHCRRSVGADSVALRERVVRPRTLDQRGNPGDLAQQIRIPAQGPTQLVQFGAQLRRFLPGALVIDWAHVLWSGGLVVREREVPSGKGGTQGLVQHPDSDGAERQLR